MSYLCEIHTYIHYTRDRFWLSLYLSVDVWVAPTFRLL